MLFLVVFSAFSVAADFSWIGATQGGDGSNWADPQNWSPQSSLPTISDPVLIEGNVGDGNWPAISNYTASAYHLFIGFANTIGTPQLTVQPDAQLNIGTNGMHIGFVGDAIVTTSGTINIDPGWLFLGEGNEWGYGAATMIVNGGTVTAPVLSFGTFSGSDYLGGRGLLKINDGTVSVGYVAGLHTDIQQIDISSENNAQFIIDGNWVDSVNWWVSLGHLTADGGTGQIQADYNITTPSKTTVTAQCTNYPTGDLNTDCFVNFFDVAQLAQTWLNNINDLAPLAENWLDDTARTPPPGLIANHGATLLKGGKLFRRYGVNFFDAFYMTLLNGANLSYDLKFYRLAQNDINYARIAGCGFWAIDYDLYLNNKTEYFNRFDAVIASAEIHGIGLIPSLFWAYFTVPDIVGEPCNRWGDPDSATIAFMRQYVADVVDRYKDSSAIIGWEIGNEWHLAADLPNAADWRPPIVPGLGTPTFRTAEDDMTHEMLVYAISETAKEIRKYDPHKMISSGNSVPRSSAWHQWQYLTWETDTPAQHAIMLAEQNPDPIDTISIHYYEQDYDLAFAAATALDIDKPLLVGEYGVPEEDGKDPDLVEQEFYDMFDSIVAENIPFSCVWVYERDMDQGVWNTTFTNDRAYQLNTISQQNQK